ncbi:AAA domain containing protein [uncultured Caudovirales phage]|uniref:AAA domain containing protein n=1 Tax=uncultured Caudovirales phage TaxID=2100421 RepID=A0A6J5QTJ1_9CAUD|nr:AAA domain containing protein [uncultured Caudovirales phage]
MTKPETKPARKSKLLAVAPETVEPKKPKVLIFGAAGVGKTWTSLDFPGVYYIDTEGGADLDHYRAKLKASNGMYFGPDQGSLDFETVIGQVEALATEDHPYKTIVFDSITKLFNSAIADEQMRLGDKDAFGASKKGPIRQMAKLLRWINRVDMNVIMIAHEKPLWGLANGSREEIGKTFDAYEKLEYELHFVLRIIKMGSKGEGIRRALIGKSRLTGFPEGEQFDWSYAEFAARYGKDVIEKAVTQVVLASPEQLAEMKRLSELLNVPDEIRQKWFTKYGVESFEEMDTATIASLIKFMQEKKAS